MQAVTVQRPLTAPSPMEQLQQGLWGSAKAGTPATFEAALPSIQVSELMDSNALPTFYQT